MSTRYCFIVTQDDGSKVVSNVAQYEGTEPPQNLSEDPNTEVVECENGVKIGMVAGGPVDAVGGYGFPEGTPSQAAPPPKIPATDKADVADRSSKAAAKEETNNKAKAKAKA